MSRIEFTRKVRAARWKHAGGECEKCHGPIRSCHYDHDTPLWLGGESTFENCRVLCVLCHRDKTALEAPQRAKGDRIRDKAIGALTSRNPLPGGRQSPWKRKLSGEWVRR
jgi:5-methylcytosine-specific restriction endonuclease McrA